MITLAGLLHTVIKLSILCHMISIKSTCNLKSISTQYNALFNLCLHYIKCHYVHFN